MLQVKRQMTENKVELHKLARLCGGNNAEVHGTNIQLGRPEYLVYNSSRANFAEIVHHNYGICKLFYEIYGSGPKCILFLMGLAATHVQFQMQFKEFGIKYGDEYTVMILDNRGIGFSDTPFGLSKIRWTTSDMASDIVQLLNQIEQKDSKWSRDVALVGYSMGGMVALELALLAPHKFSSLNLISTHAGGLRGTIPPIHGYLIFMKLLRHLGGMSGIYAGLRILYPDKHLKQKISEHTEDFSDLYKDYPDHATVVESIEDHYGLMLIARGRKYIEHGILREMDLDGLFLQLSAVISHYISWERLALLRSFKLPTIIICGKLDNLVNAYNSCEILAPHLKGELLVFGDAGHGVNEQYATEVNLALKRNIDAGYNLSKSLKIEELKGRSSSSPEFWHPWKVILAYILLVWLVGINPLTYLFYHICVVSILLRIKFGRFR